MTVHPSPQELPQHQTHGGAHHGGLKSMDMADVWKDLSTWARGSYLDKCCVGYHIYS